MAGGVIPTAGKRRDGPQSLEAEERTGADRTRPGIEAEEAPKEALAHARGEITLPCRIFGGPSAGRRDLSPVTTPIRSGGTREVPRS